VQRANLHPLRISVSVRSPKDREDPTEESVGLHRLDELSREPTARRSGEWRGPVDSVGALLRGA